MQLFYLSVGIPIKKGNQRQFVFTQVQLAYTLKSLNQGVVCQPDRLTAEARWPWLSKEIE